MSSACHLVARFPASLYRPSFLGGLHVFRSYLDIAAAKFYFYNLAESGWR